MPGPRGGLRALIKPLISAPPCDYVFMYFAPSFLRPPAAPRDTRITESKRRRRAVASSPYLNRTAPIAAAFPTMLEVNMHMVCIWSAHPEKGNIQEILI